MVELWNLSRMKFEAFRWIIVVSPHRDCLQWFEALLPNMLLNRIINVIRISKWFSELKSLYFLLNQIEYRNNISSKKLGKDCQGLKSEKKILLSCFFFMFDLLLLLYARSKFLLLLTLSVPGQNLPRRYFYLSAFKLVWKNFYSSICIKTLLLFLW